MFSVVTYLTHDNIFSFQVLINSVPVDLVSTGVFRVVVTAATWQLDSDTTAGAFDYITDGADGIIHFDFADQTLEPGKYQCDLTIYDSLHANGQVWADMFELTVNPQVVREGA